jgi:23S rRNA (uracil1939-C5)-methyltransferase
VGEQRVRLGHVLELTVEKGVYRGLGLARHEGQVVFVPRGLPGERVRARVEKVGRGFVRAGTEKVLTTAPERREPPCPLFERCGGCAYQHLDYPAQLRLKEGVLRESLARAGSPWDGTIDVVASPEAGWRTRARFHLQEVAGEWRLGLHEEGSHRVVDLDSCLQVSPGLLAAARGLLDRLAAQPSWARRVSEIALAESADGQERAAALRWDGDPAAGAGLAALATSAPWLTGLGLSTAEEGGSWVGLSGSPFVESEAAGVRYRAHVLSFFQANRHLLDPLVERVREWSAGPGPVLDLFAGVGLFALALAEGSPGVTAVEQDARSAEDAEFNRERAGLGNVRIMRSSVAGALGSLPSEAGERIVLDPPRTGAGPDVGREVAARRPASVVYVSCDPPTLGRDLAVFAASGYVPERVAVFDLFPDTFHLETVVRLVPRPSL